MVRNMGPFATTNPWRAIAWWCVSGLTVGTALVGFVLLPIANRSSVEPIWWAICTAFGLRPFSSLVTREPPPQYASTVQWTHGEVQAVSSGDPAKGTFVALNCAACHGDNGVSPVSWIPSLAGMRPDALTKQLIDYSSGHRTWPVMNAITSALTIDQMKDVAAYFNSLKTPDQVADPGLLAGGRGLRSPDPTIHLVYAGDPKRGIAPCASCHGLNGTKLAAPVLASQHEGYIERQLYAFRSGERRNDEGEQMRVIAANLTDSEIKSLAAFLSSGKQ
jgi:cytochrome c553